MARGSFSAQSIVTRSPLAGVDHYDQKLISEPKVTTQKVPSPNAPKIAAPKVPTPKMPALGGLAQPPMPTGGGLASPAPPRVKQTLARVIPPRRQLIKAASVTPPSSDEGDLI